MEFIRALSSKNCEDCCIAWQLALLFSYSFGPVSPFQKQLTYTLMSVWLKELEQLGLGDVADLYVCELPVEYQAIQSLLPSLWKEHQPQVHEKESSLTMLVMRCCSHTLYNLILKRLSWPLLPLYFGVLWAVSCPCWCFWVSDHSHSGKVWP